MFNKRADNESSFPALSVSLDTGGRKPHKVASVIGDDVTIDGNITGQGELHLDGTVRGEITVERLAIGETGQVEGTVTADTVDIRGKLTGTISAKQVKLYGTAHVDGDITHEQLSMEPGAYFQGRSLKFQRQITAPAHEIKASVGLDGFSQD
jgi:cytoskeletal protein CcmA (bactofilin family)